MHSTKLKQLAGVQKTVIMNGKGHQSVFLPSFHAVRRSFSVMQRLTRRPEPASRRIGSLLHCAPAEPPSDSEAAEGAAEFLKYLEAGHSDMPSATDQ